jgi:methylated-DNA-protein-cysteine methyltransferase-like protein
MAHGVALVVTTNDKQCEDKLQHRRVQRNMFEERHNAAFALTKIFEVSAPCPRASRGASELQVVVSPYQRIYRVVARIPRGRVATYGQIADLAGLVRGARQVGYALAALRDDSGRVPWYRVLNARGEITTRFESQFQQTQRELLESEGIVFDANGRVSLQRYQWRGVESASRARPSDEGQSDR